MKNFAFFSFLAFAFLFTCCKSPRIVTVTEYKERVTHDTIELERVDSVRVVRYVREKSDTVHIIDTVEKYRNLWRDRVQVEQVHDSVPYAVEVQVPVRMRNGYDRFTSWGFWILLLLLVLRIAWWFVKKYYLRA